MLSFKALEEKKKTAVKINPKKNDLLEKSKKHPDDCPGCEECEEKDEKVVEGVGDAVKKGVKRHKDAVEKKKIKNRKAVPYAVLAAETQPEGDVVLERDFTIGAKEREKFHTFYKKAKAAKAKEQADSTRSDSRKSGIKFGDAKGTGRIRGGKKYYD